MGENGRIECIKACLGRKGKRRAPLEYREGGWHSFLKACMADLKSSPVFGIGKEYSGVRIKDGAVSARLRLERCSELYKKEGGKGTKYRPLESEKASKPKRRSRKKGSVEQEPEQKEE